MNKTIYRHLGFMYGVVPCLLEVDIYNFKIKKYKPMFFWLYPLYSLMMLFHYLHIIFCEKYYGKSLPKIPFYRIRRLKKYVIDYHD